MSSRDRRTFRTMKPSRHKLGPDQPNKLKKPKRQSTNHVHLRGRLSNRVGKGTSTSPLGNIQVPTEVTDIELHFPTLIARGDNPMFHAPGSGLRGTQDTFCRRGPLANSPDAPVRTTGSPEQRSVLCGGALEVSSIKLVSN